ncbi:MAG TPA: cytochrome c oxidase assembly protein [Longimicrobiales bacterium]
MPASPAATLALLHGDGSFSWTRFEVHASVLVGCLLFAWLYLWAVGPLRRRHGWGEPAGAGRVTAFLAGTAILFLSLNGPIHDLSDNYLFSAHMVQHLLITLAVPPLFLIGTPPWLLRPLLRPGPLRTAAGFLTSPFVAFTIYNVVFAGWHFPAAYDLALVNHDVHIVQHLSFIAAAVIMWWPIAGPVQGLSRLSSPLQLLYIFALGLPMSIVAAFISLSSSVVYDFYAEVPRIFGISALEDQQIGGLIMWVPGMIVFWCAMTIVFFRWAAREERADRRSSAPDQRLAGASAP